MSTDFWTSSSRYGLVHKMRVVLAARRTSHNTYISALPYLYYLVVARKHGRMCLSCRKSYLSS